MASETITNNQLSTIPDLIKNSFLFFKNNFKKLMFITGTALIPITALQVLRNELILFFKTAIYPNTSLFILLICVFIILLIPIVNGIIAIVQQISLIYFISEKENNREPTVNESYSSNKKYFLPFIWISLLIFFVMAAGGTGILFFVGLSKFFQTILSSKYILTILISLNLLISLGIFAYIIYLALNFIFAQFILIYENVKGVEALKRSKAIMKNNWWQVFARMLIINAFFIFLSLIIIPLNMINIKIISSLLSTSYYIIFTFFSIPFALVYTCNIYKELRTATTQQNNKLN